METPFEAQGLHLGLRDPHHPRDPPRNTGTSPPSQRPYSGPREPSSTPHQNTRIPTLVGTPCLHPRDSHTHSRDSLQGPETPSIHSPGRHTPGTPITAQGPLPGPKNLHTPQAPLSPQSRGILRTPCSPSSSHRATASALGDFGVRNRKFGVSLFVTTAPPTSL